MVALKNRTNKMNTLNRYATLLCDYCLELKKGERLFVSTSTLAVPLVKEVYREATKRGVMVETDLLFSEQGKIFFDNADDDLLEIAPALRKMAIEQFDAYLVIRAPFNLKEDQNVNPEKKKRRQSVMRPITETYFQRTGNGSLKRSLCQYPTQASAQMADMSLEEYEQFIYNACMLYADHPEAEWLKVRKGQQKLVDHLNQVSQVRYLNMDTDISFSVKERIWINSDGRNNMPSGEVFTGPVEDTVNGVVHFNYPSIFMGKEVSGITLWVEEGKIIKWDANKGKDILDRVFEIDGSRYFGEVAIGTNYNIQTPTKNILFDEKIGGTIHMAVGQSYKQTGGKNSSAIHWDMIADMKDGGKIFTDDELIYENGKFLNGLLL